jgi:glycosyltransferase involved in cell wall biosynthesis
MEASGVNTNQIVIPHGNYSFYSESSSLPSVERAREQLELPKDATVFLFFGYLRTDKRLDLLLAAFREMSEEIQSQAALVIAGKPVSGFDEYRSMISEFGIEERIYTWPEFIDDAELPIFFQAADAVVTPYDTISESGVIHIAFGFGKPIIATNTEGFEERLQHKENGLLVEPGSVPELRRALEYAIENEEEIEQYGKQNQQESKENEWEDIAEQTVRFYQEVTNDD